MKKINCKTKKTPRNALYDSIQAVLRDMYIELYEADEGEDGVDALYNSKLTVGFNGRTATIPVDAETFQTIEDALVKIADYVKDECSVDGGDLRDPYEVEPTTAEIFYTGGGIYCAVGKLVGSGEWVGGEVNDIIYVYHNRADAIEGMDPYRTLHPYDRRTTWKSILTAAAETAKNRITDYGEEKITEWLEELKNI